MKDCLIFGSGRSGTSMLAGTLFEAGYYMGDNLYPPRESNPKGFFENSFINGLNEDIIIETRKRNQGIIYPYKSLRRNQMWLDVLPLGIKLYSNSSIKKRIKKALSMNPFCYKDPRLSYTFPVWERLIKKEVVNLIIFRHPAITAESIIKECNRMEYLNDIEMNFERAINIWKTMYFHILTNFNNKKNWIFLHYEQLFDIDIIKKLENILEANLNKDFPDKNLKRSVSNKSVPSDVMKIYNKLCDLAEFKDNEFKPNKIKYNKTKSIDKDYYIKMDIELLLKKRALTDSEKMRLALDYLKINDKKNAEIWFNKILKENKDKEIGFKALIKLNDLGNLDVDENYLIMYLRYKLKKRNKSVIDIYNIASMYKILKRTDLSIKWFDKVINKTEDKKIKSGAYFHLGEIELLLKNNKRKAIKYLEKCLKLNPKHRKAKEYLDDLKS